MAGKGFMMHDDFAEHAHELVVPPKAHDGQLSPTVGEALLTCKAARKRAIVERAFGCREVVERIVGVCLGHPDAQLTSGGRKKPRVLGEVLQQSSIVVHFRWPSRRWRGRQRRTR